MLKTNFGQITLLIALFFLSVALTTRAQPPVRRGAGNVPKSSAAPTAVGQTTPIAAITTAAAKKKSVVVLDFNDVSLTADSVKRPIGKQLAVLLTTEFAKRGNFSVISQRDKEIAEERIKSRSEGKDTSYASQVGKQLSANLVVFGDLIEYTIVTETSNKYIKKDVKNIAKVGFTITLVDVSTNEVKDGVTIEYAATSKDTDYGIYNTVKPLTEDQRITLLTEASKAGVVKAVDKLNELFFAKTVVSGTSPVKETEAKEAVKGQNELKPSESINYDSSESAGSNKPEKDKKDKGGWFRTGIFGSGKNKNNPETRKNTSAETVPPVSGGTAPTDAPSSTPRIAAIDGQEIFVRNLPGDTRVGTRLTAFRLGKVTRDKITGEVLKQEETVIGEMEVVSKNDKSFVCKLITGSGITEETLIKFAK